MSINQLFVNAPNPEDFAGFLIWQLSNKWEKYVNQQLKEFNTSQAECFHLISILQLSARLSEVTQVDVARVTGGSMMNTSKILKSLERKQWITRQTASDPRAKKVEITEAGIVIAKDTAMVLGKANEVFFGVNHTGGLIATLQEINRNHS